MPACKTDLEVRLFAALKRITQYDAPEKLRRRAERDYGVGPEDAVEMAYENVLSDAKGAIHGVRPRR